MFGLARRAAGPAAALPRMAVRRMGGAHPGVQEPGGVLFMETPPAAGKARQMADWEPGYWATCVLGLAFGVLVINTVLPPPPGGAPRTGTDGLTDASLGWVKQLMDKTPDSRLSAADLLTEPYFQSIAVDEWTRLGVGRESTKSCRQDVLDAVRACTEQQCCAASPVLCAQGGAALGVPEIANIVEAIDRRMESLPGYGEMPHDEQDHRFAIFLYTQNQGKAFAKFNEALRERPRGALLGAWSGFLWHLMAALKDLPVRLRPPTHSCVTFSLCMFQRRPLRVGPGWHVLSRHPRPA